MPEAERFRAKNRDAFERSMNLPTKSPMPRGLQLKSHGPLFKGGTGLRPADPLWLQSVYYSGELSLRKARCMRPPWTGAFLQRNAGPVEFSCGRGFAVQRRGHPSTDAMGHALPGANETNLRT